PRAAVRNEVWRLPRTITTTDSSPNCRWNWSVARDAAEFLPTSVLVDALGSSRRARANPTTASAPTTATVATGWSVTVPASERKRSAAPRPALGARRRRNSRLTTALSLSQGSAGQPRLAGVCQRSPPWRVQLGPPPVQLRPSWRSVRGPNRIDKGKR